MKAGIYIFMLGMLAVGSVVAQEGVASASRTSTAANTVTVTDAVENIISASSASEGRVSSLGSRKQPESRPNHAQTSYSGAQTFDFHYDDDRIERAIDERTIDRLGLFDRPDSDSGRRSVSFDVENEDSDRSFEVTFTVEF